MATPCLLFAYGLLRPEFTPPRSMVGSWPDRVLGRLYDLGPYPVAVELGRGPGWVGGATLEIDAGELALLDAFEDTDSGEFARIVVETEAGLVAWAYEYRLPIPAALLPITRWTP